MKLPTKNAGKVVCVLSGLVLQTENNELCLASISKTFWMMFSHYNNKEKEQCAITAKILLHPCVFDGYQCCIPLSSQSCHFRVCDYKIVYACMADKMRYSFAPQSHIQESYSLQFLVLGSIHLPRYVPSDLQLNLLLCSGTSQLLGNDQCQLTDVIISSLVSFLLPSSLQFDSEFGQF